MQAAREQPQPIPEEPMELPPHMEVVYLGLILRGPQWTPDETPELEQLQQAHQANIERLKRDGKLAIAGPMLDEEQFRGVYVFRAGSMAEAEALAASDPSVQAGRLVVELHPWLIPKGILP